MDKEYMEAVDEAVLRGDEPEEENPAEQDEVKAEDVTQDEVEAAGDADEKQVEEKTGDDEPEIDINLLKAVVGDDESGKSGNENSVPGYRFREVYAGKREAERKVLEMQSELEALKNAQSSEDGEENTVADHADFEKDDELSALEEKYTEAVFNGDAEEATRIRREANAKMIESVRSRIEADVVGRVSAQAQHEREMMEAASVFDMFAVQVGGDEEAVQELLEFASVYEARGMGAGDAMRSAADKLAVVYARKDVEQADEAESKAAADTRTAEAVSRAVKHASKQPPSLAGAGIGGAAEGIKEVSSQEDWDNLSEKDRKRLLAG